MCTQEVSIHAVISGITETHPKYREEDTIPERNDANAVLLSSFPEYFLKMYKMNYKINSALCLHDHLLSMLEKISICRDCHKNNPNCNNDVR